MLNKLLTTLALAIVATNGAAQYYTGLQEGWLEKAEAARPPLTTTIHHPVAEVRIVPDATAFQGYRAEPLATLPDLYSKSFKEKKEVVVDFGEHLVGTVTIKIRDLVGMQDAALRFKATFGEVPSDLALPIEPYTGSLSRGWMQDFVFDIMYDGIYTLPRRITARYMKLEAIGTSIYSDFCIDTITFAATTSAGTSQLRLAESTPQVFRDIARVCENTLRSSMQGVFEDGPKRDQRLWMGDLYLQALANTASFREHRLTKRSLYLLAGLANPDNGLLYSNLVEYPQPRAQKTFFVDYALSYTLTLLDYYDATADLATARDLWPVAQRQIEAVLEQAVSPTTMLYENTSYQFPGMVFSMVFFDWSPTELDKHAAMQSYLVYVVDRARSLAEKIGRADDVKTYKQTAERLRRAARRAYWDSSSGTVLSGKDRQLSYTGTSWAVLADIVSAKEARTALANVMASPKAIKPGTPYANHFLVAAMLHAGMNAEARTYVEQYWGGMVRLGADTFWEYYVPDNHLFSSYGGYTLLNSYCHAWSCTPVYFIDKYPEIFQK